LKLTCEGEQLPVNQVNVKGKEIKSQAEELMGRAQDQVQGTIAAGENAYRHAKNA
jgi:hypothetical protein